MSEGMVPFKQQLDDIRVHLEKCKIDRERRHSEFTKRFDDIVTRHDRLTSGRIRRLSLEGIIVDIDAIRGPRREHTFCATGINDNISIPYLKRSKTESDGNNKWKSGDSTVLKEDYPKMKGQYFSSDDVLIKKETRGVHREDMHSHKQLRLEISFDSKNPENPHLIKPTRMSLRKDLRSRRNASFLNPQSAKQNRNKFQKAYTKVVHIQRFTTQRRHTILSMASIGLGEKPQDDRSESPNKLNNSYTRNSSPGFYLGSQMPPTRSGKQKFRRAIKKLKNATTFSDLIKERQRLV